MRFLPLFFIIISICLIDCTEKRKVEFRYYDSELLKDSLMKAEEMGDTITALNVVSEMFRWYEDDYSTIFFALCAVKTLDHVTFIHFWKLTYDAAKTPSQREYLLFMLADYAGDRPKSQIAAIFVDHFEKWNLDIVSRNIAYAYHEVGMIYYFRGDYINALRIQEKGFNWFRENDESVENNIFYSNLFVTCLELRDKKRCIELNREGRLNLDSMIDSVFTSN